MGQSRCWIVLALLWVWLECAISLAPVAIGASDTPGPTSEPSASVQRILSLSQRSETELPALREYARQVASGVPPSQLATTADRIVADLLNGTRPDLLTTSQAPQFDVAHVYGATQEARWLRGGLLELHLWLVEQAESPNNDAGRAGRYARAGLLLASLDGITLADSPLLGLLSRKGFVERMMLPEEQQRALLDWRNQYATRHEQVMEHYRVVSVGLRALIEDPSSDKTWDERIAEILTGFRKGWDQSAGLLQLRLILASDLWRTLCLARAEKRLAEAARIEEVVRSALRDSPKDAYSDAWLEGVVKLPGPRPERPTLRFLRGPDDLKPAKPR